MATNEQQKAILEEVTDISPHNKAMYEAGKNLLVQSIDVGREFCKFMTTTAIGAIPTYLALLKLVLPKDYAFQSHDEIVFLVPAFLFLASSIIFVVGYFPQRGSLSLDLPAEIERERRATIQRRHLFAMIGFGVLCIGIVFACWVVVGKLMK